MESLLEPPLSPEAVPALSCLLAIGHYDGYVPLAIESILAQDMPDFELILLVNGDSETVERVARYQADPRVIVRFSPIRQLAHNLNAGLELARAPYVARMDADDIALPERFSRQLVFLDQRPELLLVSCLTHAIDAQGKRLPSAGYGPSWRDRHLWLKNAINHPGAMFRRDAIIAAGGYSGTIAQDYDLWLRLERDHGRFFEIMPERLLEFRQHDGQSRGRIESYATSAGLLLREWMVRRDLRYLVGAALFVLRGMVKGRRRAA